MLLTEEQAKEKWCPMVRLMFAKEGGGANCWTIKGPDGEQESPLKRAPKNCVCIASQCAMWRWGTKPSEIKPSLPEMDHKHGFCGLAGSPAWMVGEP